MSAAQAVPQPVSHGETQASQFLGRQVWLTSKSFNRYLGILSAIDQGRASISLSQVVSFGSEGRLAAAGLASEEVPPSEATLDLVVFRATDVEQIQLVPLPPGTSPYALTPVLTDPAIVHATSSHHVGWVVPTAFYGTSSLAQIPASSTAYASEEGAGPRRQDDVAPAPDALHASMSPTTHASASMTQMRATARGDPGAAVHSDMSLSASYALSIPLKPSSRTNQAPTSLPSKPTLVVRPQAHALRTAPELAHISGRGGCAKRAKAHMRSAAPRGAALELAVLPPLVLPDGMPDTSRGADFDFEKANARFSHTIEQERQQEALAAEHPTYSRQAGFYDCLTPARAPRGGGRGRRVHEAQRNLATFGEATPSSAHPAW